MKIKYIEPDITLLRFECGDIMGASNGNYSTTGIYNDDDWNSFNLGG